MPAYISNINRPVFQGWPGEHLVVKWKDIKKGIKRNNAWKVSVFGIFMVHFFPHSGWIRSLNAGKYGPEKLRIQTFFTRGYQLKKMKNLLFSLKLLLNSSPWKYLPIFWWDVETKHWYDMGWFCRSSPPGVFLRAGTLKICS